MQEIMFLISQGIVDGSALKPVLRQDTGYMVEKTPYMVQRVFSYTKTIVGTWWSTHVIFHLVKKPLVLVKNDPNRLYG